MPDSTQVIRYGRDNYVQHEAPTADGSSVRAGHLVEKTGGTLDVYSSDGARPSQILIAKDARQRGMELGDAYPGDGDDRAIFVQAQPGLGVHVMLAAGASVTDSETELVPDANGGLRPAAGDGTESAAVVAIADETLDNSTGGEPTPVAVQIAN